MSINQKEYLKKYLGIGKGSGTKKKKIKSDKILGKSLKIIDDDVDAALSKEIQDDLAIINEDAPQIVAVIDDRPPSLRIDEKTKDNLWKPIGQVIDSVNPIKDEKFDDTVHRENKIKLDILKTTNFNEKDNRGQRNRRHIGHDSSPVRAYKDHSPTRKINRLNECSPKKSDCYENVPKVHEDSFVRIKVELVDISPPRKSKHDRSLPPGESIGDISPPRRARNHEDNSPPRKSRRDDTLRRSRRVEDASPPRKRSKSSRWNQDPSDSNKDEFIQKVSTAEKMEKTMSGKKSGLQNAKDLAQEIISARKKEEEVFKNLSKEVSGQHAATVSRKKKTTTPEENQEKRAKEREMEAKYSRWGKGLKQVQDTLEKHEDMLNEMSKPLARYADDEDLERHLKQQERDGDPMLAYIRKKKKQKRIEAGIPDKPTYMGDFAPNRFGIPPGYRWDGVDRTNGYEKRLFEARNSDRAAEEEAMKWSTEDM